MGKLIAPLFSFGASGQVGKALVYFPWKGLNCVREFVIPTNPKSDAQTTQRNKMTAAVGEFHGATYNAADLSAWTRFAGTLAKVMTGFNAMCRAFINESILGNTWERIHHVSVDGILVDRFAVWCTKVSGGNAPTIHYGTRKTFFPDTQVMADQFGDSWRGTPLGLVANTLYYFYLDVGSSGADYARTGIYQQKTAAA